MTSTPGRLSKISASIRKPSPSTQPVVQDLISAGAEGKRPSEVSSAARRGSRNRCQSSQEATSAHAAASARFGASCRRRRSLASGLLTGKYRQGQPAPEGTRLAGGTSSGRWLSEQNLAIVEALIDFCESRRHTLLELAFSWLLTRPTVASVIAGATKREQIQANVRAADWKLTPEELSQIDAILERA